MFVFLLLFAFNLYANPYPDPNAISDDPFVPTFQIPGEVMSGTEIFKNSDDVLRVDVKWLKDSDSYALGKIVIEKSGTEAFKARSLRKDALGSYQARLENEETGEIIGYDSVGTGQEFRLIVRAMSFRFPKPNFKVRFVMDAENPQSGQMEEVLSVAINPSLVPTKPIGKAVEVKLIREAQATPKLIFNIYADGYLSSRKEEFWQHAEKAVQTMISNQFPLFEHLEIRAVFAPSNRTLGSAQDYGDDPVERDSFLGLYFLHWHQINRWYHVVYPTKEEKFRDAVGEVPYDYVLALLDDGAYWGVGNYRENTAVPASNSKFAYLLMHEIGHYFGLNEEYSTGGPTELRFAPDIEEPWSQNITFVSDRQNLKWNEHVNANTPIPTPSSRWQNSNVGPWGAYEGGYASTDPHERSKVPGFSCRMASGTKFCPICQSALRQRLLFDMGL